MASEIDLVPASLTPSFEVLAFHDLDDSLLFPKGKEVVPGVTVDNVEHRSAVPGALREIVAELMEVTAAAELSLSQASGSTERIDRYAALLVQSTVAKCMKSVLNGLLSRSAPFTQVIKDIDDYVDRRSESLNNEYGEHLDEVARQQAEEDRKEVPPDTDPEAYALQTVGDYSFFTDPDDDQTTKIRDGLRQARRLEIISLKERVQFEWLSAKAILSLIEK